MSETASLTAQKALETALHAHAKADKALEANVNHEKICAERYDGIRKDAVDVKESIDKLRSFLVKTGITFTAALLGIIGFLVSTLLGVLMKH